jgi:hypothetical protein
MSAPANVVATTLQSGGPGSYVITYSWTLGSSPSALSFSVTLYSIIWGVTAIVKGPINYTSSQLSDTYTNTVTGASYYCIVTAYAGAGQTGASAQFQSQQVSVYNPYGGPQGVQGYQGVQGLQGPTGPVGQQGLQGVQGLMQVTNYATTNQLITTGGDSTHLTAYPLFTLNGTTLSLGAGANITTAGTSNSIGGVTLNNGAVSGVTTLNASGAIATSAGFTGPSINTDSTSSSKVSGVTLNNGALSGVTTLNASGAIATSAGFTGPSINTDSTSSSKVSGVTLNNGAVSGVTSLGMGGALSGVTTLNASGAIATSAGFTGPSFSATNFVTSAGGFTGPSSSTINGISIGLTNQNVSGVGTLACGNITSGTVNGVTLSSSGSSGFGTINCGAITAPSINNGASTFTVTGTTGTNVTTMTVGAGNGTGYSISAGTINCGAITSSGNLALGANTITSGNHIPNAAGNTLGTSSSNWANVYATTFTGALTGNATGLSGTPNITVGTISATTITPSTDASYALGSLTLKFTTVYGATFSGNASGLTGTPNITVGTIGCGAITSSGALALGSNTITSGNIIPNAASNTLGTSTSNWSNVYATNLYGILASANGTTANVFTKDVWYCTSDSNKMLINYLGGNLYSSSNGTHGFGKDNFNYMTITSTATNGNVNITTAGTASIGFYGSNLGFNTITPIAGFAIKLPTTNAIAGLWDKSWAVIGGTGTTDGSGSGLGFSWDSTNEVGYIRSVNVALAWKPLTIAASYVSLLNTSGSAMSVGIAIAAATAPTNTLEVNGSCRIWNGTNGLLAASGATSWGTTSDSNLKNVIAPITNATKSLELVTPVYYSWKSDISNTRQIGVIAQEIQQAVPEAVGQFPIDSNDYLSVRFTELIPHLITAVKELSARLSNVEAQLART